METQVYHPGMKHGILGIQGWGTDKHGCLSTCPGKPPKPGIRMQTWGLLSDALAQSRDRSKLFMVQVSTLYIIGQCSDNFNISPTTKRNQPRGVKLLFLMEN